MIFGVGHVIDERGFYSEAVGPAKIGWVNKVGMPVQAQIG